MEIQMCSCGVEAFEDPIDPGKRWMDMNETRKFHHYIGKKFNWSSKMFKLEEGEHRDLFISQFKVAFPD